MNVIEQLASSLKRRDEVPNQLLAEKIAKDNHQEAITELIALLQHKNKDIQHDAIKVLYEVGERQARLISHHIPVFLDLLKSKNNRMQWGAMAALSAIARYNPQGIYTSLPSIITAAEMGSVITRDEAVKILIELCGKNHYEEVFPLLLEQLMRSPANQLPMYAENTLPVVQEKDKAELIKVLSDRLDDIEKESKRKRIEKVIRRLSG